MAESITPSSTRFVFPRWANYLLPVIVIGVVGGAFYAPVLFAFGASPKTMAIGYAPKQPVPYSHATHAGKLGLDCRYCHTTVEKTAFAALPPTQTCMNCHTNIKRTIPNVNHRALTEDELSQLSPALREIAKKPTLTDDDLAKLPPEDAQVLRLVVPNPNLEPIRHSWTSGEPMHWVKVHDLPDYVYFNHSAHVNHGVGCIECHGRIDRMEVVRQEKPLSMGWCLECHRDPGSHLRPKEVAVTNMDWNRDQMSKAQVSQLPAGIRDNFDVTEGDFVKMSPEKSNDLSAKLLKDYGIRDVAYMQSCYTCHR
ncbi:MAG TPA: cytochrome c3 family protein [Tepidisphaeraceae bacterium]|nr:cytochrome c3 family protein [Tepidisphaeraceae bacterium]